MRNIIKRIIESNKQNPNSNVNKKFSPSLRIKKGSCCGGKK